MILRWKNDTRLSWPIFDSHTSRLWRWYVYTYREKLFHRIIYIYILLAIHGQQECLKRRIYIYDSQWEKNAPESSGNLNSNNGLLMALQWCHNGRHGVANHQRLNCLLNPSVQAHIKEKTSKLRVTEFGGDSTYKGPVTRRMFTFVDVVMEWLTNVSCIIIATITQGTHNA